MNHFFTSGGKIIGAAALASVLPMNIQDLIFRRTLFKKAKWLSEESLQIAEKRRELKAKEKRKIYPFECRVPKNSKER